MSLPGLPVSTQPEEMKRHEVKATVLTRQIFALHCVCPCGKQNALINDQVMAHFRMGKTVSIRCSSCGAMLDMSQRKIVEAKQMPAEPKIITARS